MTRAELMEQIRNMVAAYFGQPIPVPGLTRKTKDELLTMREQISNAVSKKAEAEAIREKYSAEAWYEIVNNTRPLSDQEVADAEKVHTLHMEGSFTF